ncbi:alkanesulfonate monooxygenase SsuD/methylene tetrahydromethanopterin reductase-like flavin-dependent oxidoreductase (luciferase family) [Cellulosimicrobium cellulans]|uniref:LLM class flavin-dependent oxidoreductase n=1 Tax=Cellulosimicrobium cellulans TaxID=1710 RepID=UPI001EF89101|nr:LLM class flavin-dependent oxidoreductase [Cellulosimicrobium cellulans]MBM7820576.1 alkanesulfonate monooxygenase SsuD/methylene tetrahydromethanopterin reductase-like flavin-dependent oxidoreductase (luciferase family) [Cellulosimicrobium cellulans]
MSAATTGTGSGIKVGVVGSFGSAAQVLDMAVGAEESGWDGFYSWDGLSLLSMPVDTFDPWAVLAAAAVRTERIALGAMVFALPRRRPWEVVRQALTVDHLSGGRLVLPVGVGVLDDGGFSAVPGQQQSLRERAELLDDAIAYLDRAWSGEKFAFDGTHVHAGEMLFLPRPVERPVVGHHVPVWPVGVWDAERPPLRSLDRALRADGIVLQLRGERGFDVPTPDDVSALVAWLTTRRAELGLDAARPFDVVVQGELPVDRSAAADQLAGLADAGATWWVESRWNPGTATPESLLAAIDAGPPRP